MGKPMAENLQKYLAKNDQSLIFNNRTMASGDNLKSLGASPASSFGELVQKSDVVFTMVCSKPINNIRKEILMKNKRSTTMTHSKVFYNKPTIPRTSLARSSSIAQPCTQTQQKPSLPRSTSTRQLSSQHQCSVVQQSPHLENW